MLKDFELRLQNKQRIAVSSGERVRTGDPARQQPSFHLGPFILQEHPH